MSPLKLSFIIRATYDLLPTNANLAKWYKEDGKCLLCGGYETLKHVLNGCKVALAAGRYTWRHNRVLSALVEILQKGIAISNKAVPSEKQYFIKEGSKKPTTIETNRSRNGLFDGAKDWIVSADLPNEEEYPAEIKESNQRPDIVVYSRDMQTFILIELTVPYESNIEEQHIFKTAKYEDLIKRLNKKDIRVKFFAVEVGSRGFMGSSMYTLLRQLNLGTKKLNQAVKNLRTITENASCWIWTKRRDKE